jgi:hypothetical protein
MKMRSAPPKRSEADVTWIKRTMNAIAVHLLSTA